MTNEDYEELKRVARIRGVPEPTEATPEEFEKAQKRETLRQLRACAAEIASELRCQGPKVWTPGPGYPIPERFLRDGKIKAELLRQQ